MTAHDIDPMTGLPAVGKNRRWKIVSTTYTVMGLRARHDHSYNAYKVKLQERTLFLGRFELWFNVHSNFIRHGRHAAHLDMVSEHDVVRTAEDILSTLDRWRRDWERERSLVGTYPPKKIKGDKP